MRLWFKAIKKKLRSLNSQSQCPIVQLVSTHINSTFLRHAKVPRRSSPCSKGSHMTRSPGKGKSPRANKYSLSNAKIPPRPRSRGGFGGCEAWCVASGGKSGNGRGPKSEKRKKTHAPSKTQTKPKLNYHSTPTLNSNSNFELHLGVSCVFLCLKTLEKPKEDSKKTKDKENFQFLFDFHFC